MGKRDHDNQASEPLAGASYHEEPEEEQELTYSLSSENAPNEVQHFADSYGLTHKLDVLQKAAILLQGDTKPSNVPDITSREIAAIQNETTRKWRQPRTMYLAIIITALGAMGQGWAQTSMNGANLYFPAAFGIGSDSAEDNFIVGLINSGIYLSNGLLGAWLVAPLNARLGRRGAVCGATTISLLSNIGGALSQNWQELLAFRLVLGCALGVISSTLNVYVAECAPAIIRGAVGVSWQMFCAFGIFIGFVANVAVYNYGPNTWRLQLAAPFLSTIPLLLLVYLCPESPSWHIKHGSRYDLAFHSLTRLRNTELQAAKELYHIYQQRTVSATNHKADTSYLKTLTQLFTIPRIRRATLAAYTVMISQQLCGINIIAFFSSTIFRDANFSNYGALLASVAFGFINFIGAFPAVWTMDTLGRRSLLLLTLPLMAITMLAAGLSFSIPSDSPAHFGLLATMIYLFCAEYSPGMGPVPAAYSAEVFPLSHREIGVSSAVAVTNIWASALSLTFPALLSFLGSQGAFTLYAALNVVAFLLVFLFVPETRLKTLDELDHVFSISTTRFVRYQVMEYVPWWTRRYVLRQSKVDLSELETEEEYRALDQEDDETD